MFVAVAETKGFRAAGDRLGVSGSAVSQALHRLEERVGIGLVQRTTRSVRLTEAGARLYAAARPALAELRTAVAALGAHGDEPRGTLRLQVAGAAESFLSGALIAGFLAAHPRFDGGIRLGEVIGGDMIAVPVSGDRLPPGT